MVPFARLLASAGLRVLDLGWRAEKDEPYIQFHDGPGPDAPLLAEAPARELGLPPSIAAVRDLSAQSFPRLPDWLSERLRHAFDPQKAGGRPQLLHFRQLDGYLAMMPWEQLLSEAGAGTFRRCPYHLLPALRTAAFGRVGVLLGRGVATEAALTEVLQLLVRLRPARVDILLTESLARSVGPSLSLAGDQLLFRGIEAEVRFIPLVPLESTRPAEASPYAGKVDHLLNPWLRGVSAALGATSVDALCMICYGNVVLNRGALYLEASDAFDQPLAAADAVTAEELDTLLTLIGARDCFLVGGGTFESMGYGQRLVADRLRQLRPGGIFVGEELDDRAYTENSVLAEFPWDSSRLLTEDVDRQLSAVINETPPLAEVLFRDRRTQRMGLPNWLAAAQRELEKVAARLLAISLERRDSDNPPQALRDTEEGYRMALARLRQMIWSHASDPGLGEARSRQV
jgi:hypothetical protein